MLLLSKQAEDFTIQSGATIVTDADSSSNPTNNAVLILQGPENISWNFGSMPVGATKYQVFLKKQTIGISDASININLIGSGSPQYSAGVATLTTEGLHSIQFTTLPTAGNNEMNIDGNKLIIDRIEWHDDTVAGTITIIDQTLPPVTAGTNGNAIALTAPTTTSCADSGNRTVIGMGVGITLKKNGVVLAVNGTFTASDTLTYDVASNVPTTTAHNIFLYKAAGACGDSNVASITANVTAAAVGTISIIDQTLPPVTAGTNGNAIALTAPTTTSCADSGNRTVIGMGVGITLKKNGVVLAVNGTFTASDTLTYDVASNVPTTTAHNIFLYKAAGACGDSNVASITANVTAAAVGTITIIDQTLPPVTAGTNGVVVAFTAPTTSGCTDTNGRILIDNGVGITVKKNGVTMAISDTFLASDVITYDILSNVATTTAYNILRYKAVGACGNSNLGILTANVTAAAVGTITIIDQTLPPVTAGTNGVVVAFTAPTTSGCTDTNGRILIDNGVGITVKKNGVTMAISDTFLASDVITYDILSNVATTTAYNILRYKAVGACGNSNLGILTANVTATTVVVNSITIGGQTIASLISGSTANSLISLVAPVVIGACVFSGVRRLTAISVGVTIKKNNVAMIVGTTFTSSDIITTDIAISITAQNNKELFRYVALGACGDSNEAIILGNIIAATVSGGGYSAAPARATASTNAPAASNNTSWYWAISALLIGAVFTMILSLSRKGKAIKKNK